MSGSSLRPVPTIWAVQHGLDSLMSRPGFVQTLETRPEDGAEGATATAAAATRRVDPPDAPQLGKHPDFARPPHEPMSPRAKSIVSGTVLGVVGLGAGFGTWALYLQDPDVNRTAWTGMQVGNAVGWAAAVTGAGLFTYGLLRHRPGDPTAQPQLASTLPPVTVDVGPGSMRVNVRF